MGYGNVGRLTQRLFGKTFKRPKSKLARIAFSSRLPISRRLEARARH